MNKIFLAIIILFLSLVIFAEENLINNNKSDKYEIEIDKQVHKVYFKVKDTDEIFKTIDLIKENPYNEIPYSVVKISKSGSKYYGKIKHNKIFTNRSNFHPKIEEKISELDVEVVTKYDAGVFDSSYLIVNYKLLTGFYEDFLGEKITTRVYSKSGSLLIEKSNLIGEGYDIKINKEGTYMLYFTGAVMELVDTGIYSSPRGFKLINIAKGEVVLEKSPDSDFICSGINFLNDFANILWLSTDGKFFKHQLICLSKRIILSKLYDRDSYNSYEKDLRKTLQKKHGFDEIKKDYSIEVY